VQGVGFRYFVMREARAAGLCGFVRNLADGRVEFLLQGRAQAVGAVVEKIRLGPRHARVTDLVTREDRQASGETDFVIR
jgi:acylphosphatase